MNRAKRHIFNLCRLPFLLGAVAGVACAAAAGVSLGTVLGPLAFVPLLVPPIVATKDDRADTFAVATALSFGLLLGPVATIHGDFIALAKWGVVVLSFSLALAGVVHLLRRMLVKPVFASAITIFTSLAWLFWPVWLSPEIHQLGGEKLVGWLVPAHPIFATNALFVNLGIWTEMGTAYQLTNLNQDVAYALPNGPWWCAIAHGLVGLGSLSIRRTDSSWVRG